jgi:Xaa-Pro aminopeptidase
MTERTTYTRRLEALREACRSAGCDGWLQPTQDRFMSEYPPEATRRLAWLSGFTGSNGAALILADRAVLFTDGRYTLQAAEQCPDYEVVDLADYAPQDWLAEHAPDAVIGFDPWIHSAQQLRGWAKGEAEFTMRANLIDPLWHDQPPLPAQPALAHDEAFAGESREDKLAGLEVELVAREADAVILTLPDGVNWLLNIRGSDVGYNPLVLAYAVVQRGGQVTLITQPREGLEGFDVISPQEAEVAVPQLLADAQRILIDPAVSSYAWWELLSDKELVEVADPTLLPKALKNEVEREGMREAHRRDGRAVSAFLSWLEGTLEAGTELTEIHAARKLEEFRRAQKMYHGPSFATIAGSGPHGAIIHYHATPESDRVLGQGELFLLDSGGQYDDGTTDITRTIACGTPTAEMKANFTRVLKGHIAIDTARFPEGTTGGQLDVLARHALWQAGLDYAHGTGHGVGSYLCVHEGPQRISKRGGDVPLREGMILSNEPGYYKNGEYGIRIENLVMVVRGADGFLEFETLTLAPIDLRLVEENMLTPDEKQWLQDYHAKVAANNRA